MTEDYNDLVRAAMAENDLVKNTAEHIGKRTEQMRADQLNIVNTLGVESDSNLFADYSAEGLKRAVLDYINNEMCNIGNLNKALNAGNIVNVPQQILNNKMSIVLSKAYEQVKSEDESALMRLSNGDFKPEESFYDWLPMLRTNSYWGSTKGTITSAKLLCIDFTIRERSSLDYFYSSILHAAPFNGLPSEFVNSNSKFSIEIDGTHCFAFIHGGYAFGGQRGEERQYEFGAEDCSSMLIKQLQLTHHDSIDFPKVDTFSTLNQLHSWRYLQSKPLLTKESKQTTQHYYDLFFNSAPKSNEVQAGDIYLLRKSKKSDGDPFIINSGSGHTGVVIGNHPSDSNKALILECARDMEIEDSSKNIWGCAGAGIGVVSKEFDQSDVSHNKRVMFLRPLTF